MSLITWVMLGLGAYLMWCAAKGYNPLAYLASRIGVQSSKPAKLAGA